MRPLLALLGVGAACAACCAIPLALPMIGGLAVSGVLGVAGGWPLALAALALGAMAAAVWHVRRRRRACAIPAGPQKSSDCGCGPAGAKAGANCGGA
nr:hypothetical protein [uncultured Caldimonas sp.]